MLGQLRDHRLGDRLAARQVERVGHHRVDAHPPVVVTRVGVLHPDHLRPISEDAKRALGSLLGKIALQDGQQDLLKKLAAHRQNGRSHRHMLLL